MEELLFKVEIPFWFILIVIHILSEYVMWEFTHNYMAKKCHYDCEKCEDWSCQKSWCDEKRKKYLEKQNEGNKK